MYTHLNDLIHLFFLRKNHDLILGVVQLDSHLSHLNRLYFFRNHYLILAVVQLKNHLNYLIRLYFLRKNHDLILGVV